MNDTKQRFVDELKIGDRFTLPQGDPKNVYILKECSQSSDHYFVRYKKCGVGGGKYKRRQKHRMIVIPML